VRAKKSRGGPWPLGGEGGVENPTQGIFWGGCHHGGAGPDRFFVGGGAGFLVFVVFFGGGAGFCCGCAVQTHPPPGGTPRGGVGRQCAFFFGSGGPRFNGASAAWNAMKVFGVGGVGGWVNLIFVLGVGGTKVLGERSLVQKRWKCPRRCLMFRKMKTFKVPRNAHMQAVLFVLAGVSLELKRRPARAGPRA